MGKHPHPRSIYTLMQNRAKRNMHKPFGGAHPNPNKEIDFEAKAETKRKNAEA